MANSKSFKFALFLVLFSIQSGWTQDPPISPDSIKAYFDEIQAATKEKQNLWGNNLYGPMLLVNRKTRQVFANEPDSAGVLKAKHSFYVGIWPENMSVANTAINWGGKRWAMIMLPLPENKYKRINLLAHELFHKAQPVLGFTFNASKSNKHLDRKEGRILLRLELEALKKAVQSKTKKERQRHLTNALTFRKYRHSVYPESKEAENILELNEGLAEFTGAIVSGRSTELMKQHFAYSIDDFFANPTFVRSFAYETIPVYGYLLYLKNKSWPKEINTASNLTNYFVQAFDIGIPTDLKEAVKNSEDNYNGKTIIAEETTRAKKNAKRIAEYRKKFIEQPHFELPIEIDLKKISVAFDPRTIMPLGEDGIVYPSIRVTDLWGTLEVEKNGALITTEWTKISLSNPVKIEEAKITGDGWTLKLNEGYVVEKEESSGNFILKKEQWKKK